MNSASIPSRAAMPSAWRRQRAYLLVWCALVAAASLRAQPVEAPASDAPPETPSESSAPPPPLPSPSDDPTIPPPGAAPADPGAPGGQPARDGSATPAGGGAPVDAPVVDAAPAPLEPATTRRTWRNREGRSFVGELVSLEPPKVIFKRVDNRYFQLSLEQLAKGDVDWLARQQEAAQKSGTSLAVPIDLGFRVVRRVETPGRLVDTGVTTPMGSRVQRREAPAYAVLLRGHATGQMIWVPVAADLYRIWTEGRDVSRSQLAFLLNSNEVDLAGAKPYGATP